MNCKWIIEVDEGMVVVDDERCFYIGCDVLCVGGNVVDVVVVIFLCLGVVNLVVSGFGGGVFLLLWLWNGIVMVYDMWEIVFVVVCEVNWLVFIYKNLLLWFDVILFICRRCWYLYFN